MGTQNSTEKRIDSTIEGENKRLRQDHSGVTIIRRGSRLYLRATLPPKLRSNKTKPHQQYLALGIYANPTGVKTAAFEARKVSALVSLRQFDWKPYLRHREIGDIMTFGDLVNSFKQHFFNYGKAKHKDRRWQTIERTLKLLPLEAEFTMPALEKAALKIIESSEKPATRRNAKQELVQFIHYIEREKKHDL